MTEQENLLSTNVPAIASAVATVASNTIRQDTLETTFNGLIINAGNSNAEIVTARGANPSLVVRLDGVTSQLAETTSQLVTKASKTEVFTMDNMGQDIRTALTGGSVAVVGTKSTDLPNLTNTLANVMGAYNESLTTLLGGYIYAIATGLTSVNDAFTAIEVLASGGDRFKLTVSNNGSASLMAMLLAVDGTGAILDTVPVGSGVFTNYEYFAPPNTAKLLITKTRSVAHSIAKMSLIDIAGSINNLLYYRKIEGLVWVDGYYNADALTAPTVVTTIGWKCTSIPCVFGEKYSLTAFVGSSTALCLTYDVSNNLVSKYEYHVASMRTDFEIVVKSNEVLMCITAYPVYVYLVKKSGYLKATDNYVDIVDIKSKINSAVAVSCEGDSLTSGTNLGDVPSRYPSILQTLLPTMAINNYGVGGEGSESIALRQGAYPIYVNPFTIPATTATTAVTIVSGYSNSAITTLIGQSDAGINPCAINGILGTLTKVTGVYYFARLVAGTASVITRPAVLKTNMSTHNSDIAIIWSGTNDSLTLATVEPLIEKQRAMIDFLKVKNYIIIGMTAKVYMPDVAGINDILRKEYGFRFLDIRQYILNYGLADAGITPTTQDNTDIANGEIPTSLRADTVHFLQAGYNIVAQQVKQKGVDLGFW